MNKKKVTFKNSDGQELVGYLDLPINQEPHNYVLFAHCFTCNKNFFSAKNIAHALTANGFGVLRFDFTGLGESEGEFAETNFSGNVEDLLAAVDFLRKNHKSPSLLIGHSLGGAAVLFAAKEIPEVKAVATIGAPSEITHVTRLIKSEINQITAKGKAVVNLGGRDFTIKEQFLRDLETKDLKEVIKDLGKSMVFLHSPQDSVVGIVNAEELYKAARHPKSFISLDGADHMLSRKKDSLYAGHVISAWAKNYLPIELPKPPETTHEVVANLGDSGFTTQVKAGVHFLVADEPEEVGGNNFGPTPYEFLSTALAACTSMTIKMYANRKKWPLENVETHVNYSRKHAEDCLDCEKEASKIDAFERFIVIEGDLDQKQQARILQIADKCPIHKTLTSHTVISTELKLQ